MKEDSEKIHSNAYGKAKHRDSMAMLTTPKMVTALCLLAGLFVIHKLHSQTNTNAEQFRFGIRSHMSHSSTSSSPTTSTSTTSTSTSTSTSSSSSSSNLSKANNTAFVELLRVHLQVLSSHAETAGRVGSNYWNSMGMIAEVPQEVLDWLHYADDRGATTVCEVGFNAGHSAAVFLAAAPQAILHIFDIMSLPYSQPQVALFKRTHSSKVHVYKGSSFDLLPWFMSKNIQCDVFSVDGDHSYEGAATDFYNALKLTRVGGKLIADDVSSAFPGVVRAWQWLIDSGYIRQKHCNSSQLQHISKSWCMGEVLRVPADVDSPPQGYKKAAALQQEPQAY